MSFSILDAAAEAPGRTALVISGQSSYTYAELAERVRRLLPELERQTAERERAALVGKADLVTLETLFGLIELGKPVLLLHPRWSETERRHMLQACAPVTEVRSEQSSLSPLGERAGVRGLPADAESILAIVPTSGSSGPSKGVLLSHRAFTASAVASAANLGWHDDDRWLLSLPIAHVGGLSVLTRCLQARRTLVVHQAERFNATDVARVVERQRITLMSLIPTTLRRLLALEPRWQPPERLRAILLGGAAAPPALVAEAADRGWPVLTTYGLTEACSQVATQTYGTVQRGEMGCGLPLPGVEVRIREGVVEVRGPQLLSGYLPEPGEDPLSQDGWLVTGDLGGLDEAGRLHVFGRRDDVIVTGGENVHAAEVEAAIEAHPAIEAACVFGVDDVDWGQRVTAALVASSAPPDDDELARHLRVGLAGFKLPRSIVYLPELARLASGKVDRKATARQAGPLLRPLRQRSATQG